MSRTTLRELNGFDQAPAELAESASHTPGSQQLPVGARAVRKKAVHVINDGGKDRRTTPGGMPRMCLAFTAQGSFLHGNRLTVAATATATATATGLYKVVASQKEIV
ncbi:hypothetical protein ACIQM4_33850 [Streptomyces sp. NPDC091272]|uniref:hypothetical protein n=1 Tax=Streptomyces sp. NPDC091272 TaxID=3365981 RepID=UPI003815C706